MIAVELSGKNLVRFAWWFMLAVFPLTGVFAQDLAPRAYVVTPLHSNAIGVTTSFHQGGVDFNGTVPIPDATGTFVTTAFSYYHSFSLLGRSANVTVFLPYGVGNFNGSVLGVKDEIYRSGLLDAGVRFSVNLIGGPAMALPEFRKWKQRRLLGASLKVIAPTGQYGPTKLISWGSNRWVFKPELGLSQRWGRWILDTYAGVWMFTTNREQFSVPAPRPQTENPVGSFESHLSYDVKPGLWVSLDGNFWWGGTATLDGVPQPETRQTASRIGGTASFPFSRHQSIKVSYSGAAFVTFGGDYRKLSVAWQYSWLGRPK